MAGEICAVEKKLKEMIAEVSWGENDCSSIKDADRLREDVGLDSVALIDLIIALEARLGVFIDPLNPDEVRAFATFGSLRRLVAERATLGA